MSEFLKISLGKRGEEGSIIVRPQDILAITKRTKGLETQEPIYRITVRGEPEFLEIGEIIHYKLVEYFTKEF